MARTIFIFILCTTKVAAHLLTNGYLFTIGGSQNSNITVDGGTYFSAGIGNTPSTRYIFNTSNSGTALTLHSHDTSWGTPANVVIGSSSIHSQTLDLTYNYPGGTNNSQNLTPQLTAANTLNTYGNSTVLIEGTTPITNLSGVQMPSDRVTLIADSSGVTFLASFIATITAYSCQLDGSSNNYCTWTTFNNFGAGQSATFSNFGTGNTCSPLNSAVLSISGAVSGGPVAPSGTQFSTYTTLLTGSSTCALW